MEDCPESLDGSASCDTDDITSHLDLVELEPSRLLGSSDTRGLQPSTVARDDDLGSLSSGSGCKSTREARNAAEKKRRDTLNTHINELSVLVPMVASSSKKMDKTSVLRLAATYLRMNKTLIPDRNWPVLAKAFDAINLSQFLMEDMEGFLLIVTAGARIIFVSHTIEKYLGHSQNDLMGQDLYSIVHEEDREELKKQLTPNGGFPCCPGSDGHVADESSSSESVSSCSSEQSSPGPPVDVSSSTVDTLKDTALEQQRRSFFIRMSQKSCSRGDQREYELIHIVGDLRVPTRLEISAAPSRSRRPKDCRYNENDIVLVAVGRIHKERSLSDLSILEATREEYITRHEPTGKMTYVDHRIAIVAGYMSEECIGMSAFNFMHKDDITWTMIALKRMYDKGDGYGFSTYRLRAKNGEYIYLRTNGYLEYDPNTQKIESFVCVNKLVSQEEGEKGIEEMRRMYSPHFVQVKQQLTSCDSMDDRLIEQIVLGSSKIENVTSSTEFATRPTVLREVASVQRVSSSSERTATTKRMSEESPRARKVRRISNIDDSPPGNKLLDLDIALQPIPHISPTVQVATTYHMTSGTSRAVLQLETRQEPHKTGRAPKKNAKVLKSAAAVQQELLKSKRGIGDVSV